MMSINLYTSYLDVPYLQIQVRLQFTCEKYDTGDYDLSVARFS